MGGINIAVKPDSGGESEYESIWIQFYNFIVEHPSEFIAIFVITLGMYFVLKWATKFIFHEVFIYSPGMKNERYCGRQIIARKVLREPPGELKCNTQDCHYVYSGYFDEEDLKHFKCDKCGESNYTVTEKPDELIEYTDIVVLEQMLWPKIKTYTIPSKRINLFKRNWRKLVKSRDPDEKALNIYKRVGLLGTNLYWNPIMLRYEVSMKYMYADDYESKEFDAGLKDIVDDMGVLVSSGMGGNPKIVGPLIQDLSFPLPIDPEFVVGTKEEAYSER